MGFDINFLQVSKAKVLLYQADKSITVYFLTVSQSNQSIPMTHTSCLLCLLQIKKGGECTAEILNAFKMYCTTCAADVFFYG